MGMRLLFLIMGWVFYGWMAMVILMKGNVEVSGLCGFSRRSG
jgi:hypothetical protein